MISDDKGKSVNHTVATEDGEQLGAQFGLMIGKALKAHYDELVEAPVPSKFLDLLAQLENAEGSKR